MLDPSPQGAAMDGTRGAPGFGSRAPGSDHIIAMMDRRSSAESHVWVAADGKIHREDSNPPLSVFSVLDTWVWDVAERRDFDHRQLSSVKTVCQWLDNQLDWMCRQDSIVDFHEDIRKLLKQLRPVTGAKAVYIGSCPNVPEGPRPVVCGARLYAPQTGETITCGACGQRWTRSGWEKLAQDLADAV